MAEPLHVTGYPGHSFTMLQPGYRLSASQTSGHASDSFFATIDQSTASQTLLQYQRSLQQQQLNDFHLHQQQQQQQQQQPQHHHHQQQHQQQQQQQQKQMLLSEYQGTAMPYADSQISSMTPSTASSKPSIPRLNLSKHDGLGFGSSGGLDVSVSARIASGSSSVASVTQQMRVPHTSRIPSISHHHQRTTPDGSDESASSVQWESGPITPAQALKRYHTYLSNYEQSEILEYPQVYFVGRGVAQKVKGNPHMPKSNYGYDDERGDYQCVVHDHLAYRYEILGILGKGSFGQVLKCHDFKTNTLTAIKVIRNKKRFHHQALVEVRILDHLKTNDTEDQHNIIRMQEYFYFRNHLCISFELLSVNLYEFIKQNNFMPISPGLIRRFSYQMLCALKYLKSLNIIHCDLKPENILLKQPNRSYIKIIDFGSSCFVEEKVYTYIQSRFYRSPEVILGLSYSTAIDMWSFGCILAELYTGYPLFPGESEYEQLLCIMEVMGLPPRSMLEQATRTKLFFDSKLAPRIVPNSRGKSRHPGTKTLQSVLKCTDMAFLDLLEKCLRWDPAERVSPEQALQHIWVMDNSPSPTSRPTARSRSEARKHVAVRKVDDSAMGLLPTTASTMAWQQPRPDEQQQQPQHSGSRLQPHAQLGSSFVTSAASTSYAPSVDAALQAHRAEADSSIYTARNSNGVMTARSLLTAATSSSSLTQFPTSARSATLHPTAHVSTRLGPYSGVPLMATPRNQSGDGTMDMSPPQSLLMETSYRLQPQQPPQLHAAAAMSIDPAAHQQSSSSFMWSPAAQHRADGRPTYTTAVGLQDFVGQLPDQRFLPQLPRR